MSSPTRAGPPPSASPAGCRRAARTWTYYEDIENDCTVFPEILKGYLKTEGTCCRGKVGNAECLLIPQRDLVDYGVEWLTQRRT